ncbi:MAG TPA: family 1 glycosylhydrolase [Acidimicrobiales bacterium]|nr:family 1 glycosylhydrolase [Acidimicrobiales bacterium]
MSTRPRTLLTLEGYAVEGGYDVAGGPATCYAPTIALGRQLGPGASDELWRDYEAVIDLAASVGLEGLRVTLEWARLAPRRGYLDEEAARRYDAMLAHARARGLWVSVVLVDAVWPAWAGPEAWLLPWVGPVFRAHAQWCLERFGDVIDAVLPFSQPDALVDLGYRRAQAPPWRARAAADAVHARANLAELDAFVRALAPEKMVATHRSLELDVEPEQLTTARRESSLDELHVRSLVRGAGPTAARAGLFARHEGYWRVRAADELLLALR